MNSNCFNFLKCALAIFFLLLLSVTGENEIEGYSTIEQLALEKFRASVKDALYRDYMTEDSYLMKFLTAKRMNLPEAATMLRSAHKWRIVNKIDSILEGDHSKMKKKLPFRSEGFDRKGQPLVEIEFGKWDLRKIMLAGQRDEYMNHVHLIFEGLDSRARNTGQKNITRAGFLVNLQGYSPRKHACIQCIPALLKTATDCDSYYPGIVGAAFLVNTPRTFEALFQILKQVMSESMRNAIKIYGYDRDEWMIEVAKNIAPDQMGAVFGGRKV